MSALPADILRATRANRVVIWNGDYVDGRDGLKQIEPGYFESAADAAAVLAIKGELIGRRRRRYTIQLQGEYEIDPQEEVPTVKFVEPELAADLPVMLTRYEYDMQEDVTNLEAIG